MRIINVFYHIYEALPARVPMRTTMGKDYYPPRNWTAWIAVAGIAVLGLALYAATMGLVTP